MTASAPLEIRPEPPTPADLLTRLEKLGARHYHHRHPFNSLMHAGRLDRGDLRLWVANRYYYQTRIPIKDALILAKSADPAFRQIWTQRVSEHHDGQRGPGGDTDGCARAQELEHAPGGLGLWCRLGHALGLSQRELDAGTLLLPPVREACDEYVELVRSADLVAAVAASLTEHFAAGLMQARIAAWQQHYPYLADAALEHFRARGTRARQDADFGLASSATTPRRRSKSSAVCRLLSAIAPSCGACSTPSMSSAGSIVDPGLKIGPGS